MRKVKFRARRLDNKRWVDGYILETPLTAEVIAPAKDGHYFLSEARRYCISKDGCVYEIDFETLGQFTGILDRNGKEVYEGDIIRRYMINKSCD